MTLMAYLMSQSPTINLYIKTIAPLHLNTYFLTLKIWGIISNSSILTTPVHIPYSESLSTFYVSSNKLVTVADL